MVDKFKKIILVLFISICTYWSFSFVKIILWDVPSLQEHNPAITKMMEEKHHHPQIRWAPFNQISQNLKKAVVTAEDSRFYQHDGIDFEELKKSIEKNIKVKSYARGASTITMQLAKNLYFSSSKNIFRKVGEIIVAKKIERDLEKNRILELYLNVIEWGKGIYGIDAASRHYFNTSPARLSAHQAAFLAAIIPNPVKWGHQPPGPYVSKRSSTILARMGYKKIDTKKIVEPTHEPELESIPENLFSDDI